MHPTYKKWIEDKCPKVICGCGCGGEIIVKEHHKWKGIPKYIRGHFIRSEESIEKMSGENNPMFGIHRFGENNSMFGKHHTEETKQKISNVNKGKHRSEETKQKISEGHKNPTKETREKMSKSHKGKIHSEETRKKISDAKKGIPRPEETKKQISKSNKGKIPWNKGKINVYTDETRQRMSKSKQKRHFSISTEFKIGRVSPKNAGYGKGSYYDSSLQGKIWLRSSYELKFAEWLDRNNILWLYEIQTFDLGNTTYTPDFYLPTCNMFIEVKGYMKKESQDKINKFLDNYNEETLKILYKKDLVKLGIKL